MEKIETNHYGWDITIIGKKFYDRFSVICIPNTNYVYYIIQEELYEYWSNEYAEQNKLSTESAHDRDIIKKWTDGIAHEFIKEISALRITFHLDFPMTLFTSLEERLNFVMGLAKERVNITPYDHLIDISSN